MTDHAPDVPDFLKARAIPRILTCVYCGKEYPMGTPAHGDEILTEHIRQCKMHPMRALEEENQRLLGLLNNPQTADFTEAVRIEAGHQRERWGAAHDTGKAPADWFWLIGYLAGKALHAAIGGNSQIALHHTISAAAACCNWHAALTGADTRMRPGIDAAARGIEEPNA